MFPLRGGSICYTYITETLKQAKNLNITEVFADLATVGGRIRYYRLTNSLSQNNLASISGINRSTIIEYENNQINQSIEICNKIAATLNIIPTLLYDEYLNFISRDYGSILKKVRKELKLTQKQISYKIGISKKSYGFWERELSYPSRENFQQIKKYLP